MSRQRALILAGCVLIAAVYALRLNHVAGMFVDDAYYVLLAQAIAAGQGYHLIDAPTTQLAAILPSFPPGFPLVLAIVAKFAAAFPANVIALKLVSVLAMFGVGALAAAYYRARNIPASLALAVAAAVVLTPAFVWLATSTVMSEPLFTLAQLAAVVLVVKRRPGLAGASAAAATLVRSAGLPIVVAVAVWYAVRREWRAAVRFTATAIVLLVPWMIYARVYASPLEVRLQYGGAHIFTYGEQFWMQRAGEIESGRISWSGVPGRVGRALVDIFGRDTGAIVLPELYRPAIESGEETLSVGGKLTDIATGSMGNATGTMVISALISLIALVGFVSSARNGADVADYAVPLALVPIVLFPHWAYRLVLPLTPFLYFYLAAGIRAITSAWQRVLRVALLCVIALHAFDHLQYRLQLDQAVWIQDARDADEVLDWMNRSLAEPGAVASTNPALVYLRTGRHGVAINSARDRWPEWKREGVRYLVSLQGHEELPARSMPYRLLFKSPRSGMWVLELTGDAGSPSTGSTSTTQRF